MTSEAVREPASSKETDVSDCIGAILTFKLPAAIQPYIPAAMTNPPCTWLSASRFCFWAFEGQKERELRDIAR